MRLLLDRKFFKFYLILLVGTYGVLLLSISDWFYLSWIHFVIWIVVFIGGSIVYMFKTLNNKMANMETSMFILTLALQDLQQKVKLNEETKEEVGSIQSEDE